MDTHDEQGGMQRPSAQRGPQQDSAAGTSRNKSSPRLLERGDLATNRILFALALLGVLLPLNTLVSHYHHLDFIYSSPHSMTVFKGPYHLHATSVFYSMAGLLAVAVYFYAFDFIFRSKIFERVGTIAYAFSLVIPPAYLYLLLFQQFTNASRNLSTPLYYITLTLISIPFALLGIVLAVISQRLTD